MIYVLCCCFLWVAAIAQAKPIVDLRDSNIVAQHHLFYDRPQFIWSTQGKNSHVIVLSDYWLSRVDECRQVGYEKVIAYLMEPRAIHPWTYQYVDQNADKFDLIMTYDRDLLEKYPDRCRFVHAVGSPDLLEEGVHPKSKLCSIMTGKDWTEGHKLRRAAYDRYQPFFDGYKGYDSPWTPYRDPWMKDFCFSVAVENSKQAHYFSEKIVHLFRSGTIPIYWGCPTIGEFFDMEGIITFDTLDELGEILKNLSFEEYERRLPAVQRNFELAAQYPQGGAFFSKPECADSLDVIWPYIKTYFQVDKP